MKIAALSFALALCLAGCIPNKAYRVKLPPCTPVNAADCSVQTVQATVGSQPADVPLAFIEFDDIGQAFNPAQIKAAEDAIHAAQQTYGTVVTIVFIHGWKNNASPTSDNVLGFRTYLQQSRGTLPGVGVVGVYFGWRGGTTNAPAIKELTYWNRRDTATYIPGSNMSEALMRVAIATKGIDYDNNSKLIVVGHSFGGLVLERTVTQYLTRRIVENPGRDFHAFADLLVFVNEAAAATEAIQFLTMLKEQVKPQLRPTNKAAPLNAPPSAPAHVEYPTIVSITSQGDLATGLILPVGQGASLIKKSLRDYGPPYPPDPFGIKDQRTYFLRSATHIPQLQSHVVGSGAALKKAYEDANGYTCVNIGTGDKSTNYYVVPIADAANTTPYWIMQMPVEIVPNHTDIFRLQFGALLQAFVLRQYQVNPEQPPDSTTCAPRPVNMTLQDRSLIRMK
jgi:hypothetical protein